MVRIGVDLTSLPGLKGGVAFYLLELVAALQRIDRDNQYCLIVRDVHASELAPAAPNFVVVPVALRSRGARIVWEQTRLPSLARELQLDVLHSPHYTRPLRRLPCRSIVGMMDLTFFVLPQYHTLGKRIFFRFMIRTCARKADRLIAISESTARDLQQYLRVPANRIDVTPLAASPAFTPDIPRQAVNEVRRRYQLPDEYVLYVGRLEPRKNLPRLLDAYAQLLQRRPSAPPLVLAGARGWHPRDLDRALNRAGSSVRAIGYVSDADLPALYAGAGIFVYPSLYEGFGIPVIEALACGVPTITSNVSSMAEVAADAAELVDPSNTSEIVSALERLMEDAVRRAELRARGIARARCYSWDLTAQRTRESYLKAARG
jgi:glycosyltransferase involved in cell wall biosynthesis